MLAGTNITSVISTAISSAFTTFLSASSTFTGTLDTFGAVAVTSLKIGTATLTSALITYLSNFTSDPQTQLNGLNSYSGKVVQMKVFQSQTHSLLTTSISGQGQNPCIFRTDFTCKLSSSQIYVHFDDSWGITPATSSGFDSFRSTITIKEINLNNTPEITIGYKDAIFGQNNRGTSITLFPISAAYTNTASSYTISVYVAIMNSDDSVSLGSNWNMTITEIQN